MTIDAEYLEELEKKAKRHDFFEGYIKGIEVAFAFAEELVKNIGNRKTESNSEKPNNCEDEPKGLCKICMNYPCGYWDEDFITHNHSVRECRAFEPKNEPQRDAAYIMDCIDLDKKVEEAVKRNKEEQQTDCQWK